MDTVSGTGQLIIGVIIILVITSTLLGANLLSSDRTSASGNFVNETIGPINETSLSFGNFSAFSALCSITDVRNVTGDVSIGAPNYTQTNCQIQVSAIVDAEYNNTNWNISSTTTYVIKSKSEQASERMNDNFTQGLDEISAKIPTILLIVAVVFLFGALVLLVAQAKRMGIGGGGSL